MSQLDPILAAWLAESVQNVTLHAKKCYFLLLLARFSTGACYVTVRRFQALRYVTTAKVLVYHGIQLLDTGLLTQTPVGDDLCSLCTAGVLDSM